MRTLRVSAMIILFFIGQGAFAQEKSYAETVVENPTAEEDLKVGASYLDALVGNDMATVAGLLADEYIVNGPSHNEKIIKLEEIAQWKEIHKTRTNQKNKYVYQTFRVLDGDYQGDWVSVRGTYSFIENGTDIVLPYQYTANVKNGKINEASIYYDRLSFAKKLGYTITPPEE
ncbi:nuclear transport factor 2 family protein [Flagellimonas meridianipacifica]|uniref:SnoaL-like protein n=1 Tax=Flagellimonas meridianipacifica TaxID=1080225 RepID=A0A2T0MEW5_9FLAO|nr:nuclear transport factor 2 family protein [Allomuricauda pacifica]PRX56104.1 SnoaL-like protein [Allomuricauda pacifica]